MQRGELTKRILEHLVDASADMIYLFAAIAVSPYGSSRRQIERKAEELRSGSGSKSELEKIRKRYHEFYNVVGRLQREGFIKKTKEKKFLITLLGKKKYNKILSRLPQRDYKPQSEETLKIIIFDIPEKARRKRDWLRVQLNAMGFTMLQKSVWAGKKGIPMQFMEDLRDLRIFHYVEIFAITKTGSLKPIKSTTS